LIAKSSRLVLYTCFIAVDGESQTDSIPNCKKCLRYAAICEKVVPCGRKKIPSIQLPASEIPFEI
jgi:hypothetical protein